MHREGARADHSAPEHRMNDPTKQRATVQRLQRLVSDQAGAARGGDEEPTRQRVSRQRVRRLGLALVGSALLLAVALPVILRGDDAREELKAAADATRAYRGWIHVEVVSAPAVGPITPNTTEMHYNTA